MPAAPTASVSRNSRRVTIDSPRIGAAWFLWPRGCVRRAGKIGRRSKPARDSASMLNGFAGKPLGEARMKAAEIQTVKSSSDGADHAHGEKQDGADQL